jgi:hypothetical protein
LRDGTARSDVDFTEEEIVKRLIAALAILVVALATLAGGHRAYAGAGNGVPSGPHYNLNIIGIQKGGSASTTSNGNVIFVPLWGSCQIDLSESVDYSFQVLQPNCLTANAQFQLPNPDPTNSGTTVYSVYARVEGKPQSSGPQAQTCFTDTTGTYCSTYTMILPPHKAKSTFTNVSQQLLYVYYVNSAGTCVRVPLFGDTGTGGSNPLFFWQWQNNGTKLAQLRFYQVPTTVASTCS